MWVLISSINKKNLSSNKIFEIQISLTLKSIKKKRQIKDTQKKIENFLIAHLIPLPPTALTRPTLTTLSK